jgi:exodeoxyribonuclease VII small subunit
MSKQNPLTYEQAYAELTRILHTLQNTEISLDELGVHLQRARELMGFCREKLYLTEKELDTLFRTEEE